MLKKLIDEIDRRIKIRELYEKHLAGYMVSKNLNFWYSMGSVLLTFFVIQIITGILLLIYYIPSTSQAFKSVTHITNEVPLGWLIRRVHAIGANIFILVLFFHMLSTLIMGSYKNPREMQWLTGCLLFALGLTACLSGYLLPWSQLSYWATTVATNSVGSIPFIGEWILEVLRGGSKVSQHTLGRFFAAHVTLVPFTIFIIIAVHIFVMRRTGISLPPGEDETTAKKEPFFPNFVLEDLKVVYIFLAFMVFLAIFYPQFTFPKDALEPANPIETPAHIKPEWYFLANYQFLKLVPNEFLGIFLQLIIALLIFFLPFIDRNPERRIWKRPIFFTLVVLGIAFYILLTIWGYVS